MRSRLCLAYHERKGGPVSPNNAVTRPNLRHCLIVFSKQASIGKRDKEAGAKNPLTREDMVVMIAEALKIDSKQVPCHLTIRI